MEVPAQIEFLRPILTVTSIWDTGETGDTNNILMDFCGDKKRENLHNKLGTLKFRDGGGGGQLTPSGGP